MDARVRPMRGEDMDAVMRIYQAGIDGGNATFETRCPSHEAWDQGHIGACRLVIEDGGIVLGWAALSPVSSRYVYRGVAELSIYLDPAYGGRGLGEKLLRALMASAEAQGFWTLQAGIFEDNRASVRLHEKCGFRLVGRRERIGQDKRGNWRDTLLYEWRNSIE